MGIVSAEVKEGILYLSPIGRVDSTNASYVEDEITNYRKTLEHSNVIIDADKLEYVSSAGLRVILRLRKEEADAKIINVSSEVYEIFEMTGFTEIIPIEKGYRHMSVDGCKIIGKGAKGAVYRLNSDTIVKVYFNSDSLPDIHREREFARYAFVLGIPTAISYDVVKVGDKYGSVFELLDAKSLSQLIAENEDNLDKYVKYYADMLKQIHKTQVDTEKLPDIKPFVLNWLETDKPYISEETYAKVKKLIDDAPNTTNMIHCDYHTNNVMMQGDEAILIDMDTLSYGHPIFELANVFITYVGFAEVDPSNVEGFLGIKCDVAKEIWNKFIPIYLETTDEDRINDVTQKARLLSLVRLMRHTIRRDPDSDNTKSVIEYCKKNIEELLEKVTTLDF